MIGRLHHVVLDVTSAGHRVLALGATELEGEDVYADPAGHPFCLIWRPRWARAAPAGDQANWYHFQVS
jgi:Glyoxalase-like domain